MTLVLTDLRSWTISNGHRKYVIFMLLYTSLSLSLSFFLSFFLSFLLSPSLPFSLSLPLSHPCFPLISAYLLGIGLGAAVALHLARKIPSRFPRIVLCSPVLGHRGKRGPVPVNIEVYYRQMFSSSFMRKYEDRFDLLLARYISSTTR